MKVASLLSALSHYLNLMEAFDLTLDNKDSKLTQPCNVSRFNLLKWVAGFYCDILNWTRWKTAMKKLTGYF